MAARSFIVQLSDTARALEASTPITKLHFVESPYVSVKYFTILGKNLNRSCSCHREEVP